MQLGKDVYKTLSKDRNMKNWGSLHFFYIITLIIIKKLFHY